MKLNYVGIVACVFAIISLLLPWFTIDLWAKNSSITMNFSANLWQLAGTVDGISKSIFLITWFGGVAFVLMLMVGLLSLLESVFVKKSRVMIFIISCILALTAMGIFGFGLVNSDYAVEDINPGFTINQFPEGSFGMSADEAMLYSYRYSWAIGAGFWLALIASILALAAALLSWKKSRIAKEK